MKLARGSGMGWLAAVSLLCWGCSDDGGAAGSTEATSDAGNEADSAGPLGADAGSDDEGADAGGDDEEVSGELTASGPVSGGMGTPFTASLGDLKGAGYSETEFFFEGTAVAYKVEGEMTMDGMWTLSEASEAPFKSRLLVRRPKDKSKFNGTVVVEWLNVSAGADGDPGFMYNFDEILREGYAWVGVSAQAAGVEGGGFSLGGSGTPLKEYDSERYGSLVHPGDEYSYDIFTKAAEVIHGAGDVDILKGLKPKRLIAYGESQSAIRMVAYVDGVHPLVEQYDGFFIHSRGASGGSFEPSSGLSLGGFGGGTATLIRTDIEAKVFQFQTETDVTGMLAYLPARQPDSDRLRSWEVAGTAHADQYLLDFNDAETMPGAVNCEGANSGPQPYVIRAALHWLNLWMTDGTPPPKGDVLETNDDGSTKTDEHGNALGGVRSPDVDVPTKTLSGSPAGGGGDFFCFLFGSTTPFSEEKLMMLYPTHEDYVDKVKKAARKARDGGFLLAPEEKTMIEIAEAAAVPN